MTYVDKAPNTTNGNRKHDARRMRGVLQAIVWLVSWNNIHWTHRVMVMMTFRHIFFFSEFSQRAWNDFYCMPKYARTFRLRAHTHTHKPRINTDISKDRTRQETRRYHLRRKWTYYGIWWMEQLRNLNIEREKNIFSLYWHWGMQSNAMLKC